MIIDRPHPVLPPADLGRVHFVGIGGAGMSGIARLMAGRGVEVSGCDNADSVVTRALAADGIAVEIGHSADHVRTCDTVVATTAVRDDNPDIVGAREAGVRLWPRAAALAALMLDRRAVAVAGTHGKTTTSSMLATALTAAGADPSFVIGGTVTALGTGAHDGTGEFFVAEADESDSSFLAYSPEIALVTTLEPDHLDHYGDAAAYTAAFDEFASRAGALVCCAEDPGAAALAGRVTGRDVLRYGTGTAEATRDSATVDGALDVAISPSTPDGLAQSFEAYAGGLTLGEVRLAVPGRTSALNAAAVLTVGLRLGFAFDDLAAGLAGYTGAGRRFEARGAARGVRVFDSYAHHPTELAADLAAAHDVARAGGNDGSGSGRVIAVFQPHLFSRTRIFAAEFAAALSTADVAIVMDVYPAREDPEPGVTGALIADQVTGADVTYAPTADEALVAVAALAADGDLVLTMGAGDVTALGPRIVELLDRPGGGHDD